MTEPTSIQDMMQRAGEWACLVGPQAAGKTVFADYLRQYAPGQEHVWSMVPLMRAATGNLTVRTVSEVARLGVLGGQASRVEMGHSGHRFHRGAGTKDIVQLQAAVGRDIAQELSITFFDVPGEWAQKHAASETDAMHQLLERTQLFVLFVSFWGLLPGKWLEANVLDVLGPEIWGTSMAGGASGGDPRYVSQAIQAIHTDARTWIQSILALGKSNMDILIVLSQFQRSTTVPLLDAFSDGLGTKTWDRYEALQTPIGPREASLGDLARHIEMTEAVGRELLTQIEARSRELGMWSDVSFVAELARLGGRGGNQMQWQRKHQAKVRSWSLLPMNVLAITSETGPRWYEHGIGDGLEDFRMCEDVLWWLMLHLKAQELWRP
jgi:hypothetical protein